MNTEYDEPPAVYASTDDAESTITSPNSVSSPNTPSTRCSEVRGRRSHWPNAVAARPTASRAALASIPNTNIVTTSEVPPEEINGSVRPVTGSSPTT